MPAAWRHPLFRFWIRWDVQVELDFLRPPSLDCLKSMLAENSSRYHAVHLDGILLDEEGKILLETENASDESVSADQIAEILLAADVPIVMVSAGDRGPRRTEVAKGWNELASRFAAAGIPVLCRRSPPVPRPVGKRRLPAAFLSDSRQG